MAFFIPVVFGVSSGLVGWAFNHYYLRGGSPKAPQAPQPEIGDFEYIKRDEEVLQEERAKIMELVDKVFISTSENTVTYDYDTLKEGGIINDDILLSFRKFPKNGYLRRCEQIGDIFKGVVNNYQKVLSEQIIQKYYGIKDTPMRCLQARLAEKDPIALRISAMLYQLGDDAEMFPPMNPDLDLRSSLEGRVIDTPYAVGRIELRGLDQFTITNDLIAIVDSTGTVIGAYTVNRTVTIGSPNADGSVECKIERVFQRFNPVHEG